MREHRLATLAAVIVVLTLFVSNVVMTIRAQHDADDNKKIVLDLCHQRNEQIKAIRDKWTDEIDTEAINPVADPKVREMRILASRKGLKALRPLNCSPLDN